MESKEKSKKLTKRIFKIVICFIVLFIAHLFAFKQVHSSAFEDDEQFTRKEIYFLGLKVKDTKWRDEKGDLAEPIIVSYSAFTVKGILNIYGSQEDIIIPDGWNKRFKKLVSGTDKIKLKSIEEGMEEEFEKEIVDKNEIHSHPINSNNATKVSFLPHDFDSFSFIGSDSFCLFKYHQPDAVP